MPSTAKVDLSPLPAVGEPDGSAPGVPAEAGETHRLPGVLASAASARRLVERFLFRLGRIELVESATLVASELVTNAVTHGRPPVHLDLSWSADGGRATLRLDVHDHGRIALHAVDRHSDDEAECGRGLLVVDHLATRWGLTPHPVHGTRAWAEITAAG
ncbi:ATP-binding protein [Nocardiopsis sp. FIRDI 009]|uniref:ATP-binding protein n=1 Tax=Nocardiopsis sp. FIRDI 009 TaxID=714197 RepID=UPI000E22833F|nr:ATP-binding protein [Nocardiopsis sp. FIRDI 009]